MAWNGSTWKILRVVSKKTVILLLLPTVNQSICALTFTSSDWFKSVFRQGLSHKRDATCLGNLCK